MYITENKSFLKKSTVKTATYSDHFLLDSICIHYTIHIHIITYTNEINCNIKSKTYLSQFHRYNAASTSPHEYTSTFHYISQMDLPICTNKL